MSELIIVQQFYGPTDPAEQQRQAARLFRPVSSEEQHPDRFFDW